MALTQISTSGIKDDAVTDAKIPANSVGNSEMKDDAIGTAEIADNAVTNAQMADDAVGVAELSATGTASSSTFLRGDNSWQAISTTPEGTAVLSTGETGGTKFLREDGDNSCSWQSVPAGGATINNATANELVTVASTTTQLDAETNLTFDGTDLTLGTGNLVIGTSGKGIDFSANAGGGTSGSADSEHLDSYEEGSWTPGFSDGSSYIDSSASKYLYLKIGNLVHLWGNVRTNGSATGVANFYIQSLPFTSINSSSAFFNGTLFGGEGWSEDLSDSNLVCQLSSNSVYLYLYKNSGDTAGSITLNNIGPNANIMFSIDYRCA